MPSPTSYLGKFGIGGSHVAVRAVPTVTQTLAIYLATHSERDALIRSAHFHLRMARGARRVGASDGLRRTHLAQVATYRRMLLDLTD